MSRRLSHTRPKSRTPRLTSIALGTALAAGGLTACGAETTTVQEDVYCATADGVIVDEDYCDDRDGGGGYFIYYGAFGGGHTPGHRLPANSPRIPYGDQAKRAELGLPKTGKVTGSNGFGTTINRTVSKGGGFGGGTSKSGGFGGSSSGG